jgi:uncharacterized RDD family membrane protein YckC
MTMYPSSYDTADAALRDQLSIRTPELVAIEFPLAGIGSRFVALLLDYLLQGATALVLVLLFVLFVSGTAGSHSSRGPVTSGSNLSEKWGIAIALAIPFLFHWGYFTLFEAFWRGQTPGKRVMRIRVIQQTGRPIGLFESMGRNLLRAIDMLPTFYIFGVITMFLTSRQQRLGDLVAGTFVVHERDLETPLESMGGSRTFTTASFKPVALPPRESKLAADSVASLTLADLQTLESYLARRLDVPLETRIHLADKLAENISCKMNMEIPANMSKETFLEEAAFTLRSMQHLQRQENT